MTRTKRRAPRPRPHRSGSLLAAIIITCLAPTSCQAGGSGEPGPLLGVDGGGAAQPLRPGDTGTAWGMHTLGNPTDSPITLRGVRLVGSNGLLQSEEPFIWDDERLELGFGSFSATVTPFPREWASVTRHEVDGYVIAPHETIGTPDGVGAEVIFTFAAADETQRAEGIEVEYEWRGRTYTKAFMSYFVMCPVSDASECS